MPHITFTASLYDASSDAADSGASLTINLLQGFSADNHTYSKDTWTKVADASGNVSASLPVPDSGTAHYLFTLPDGRTKEAYLSADMGSVALESLVTGSAVDADALLVHEGTVATTNVLGHVKVDGTTITAAADGTITAVNGGNGGGSSTPLASSSTTGTVKTDADNADPVVYLKASVDTLLANKANSSALSTEITNRTNADTALQTAIDGKADSATTLAGYGITDAATNAALTAETAARQGADTTLQGNIDAHTGNTSNPHAVTAAQVGALTQADIVYPVFAQFSAEVFTSTFGYSNDYQDAGIPYNYIRQVYGNGGVLTTQFLLAAGTYTWNTWGVGKGDCGIVTWALDGTAIISNQDWYDAGSYTYLKKQLTGLVIATSGLHTLTCTMVGKNASSTDWGLYLGLLTFLKTS